MSEPYSLLPSIMTQGDAAAVRAAMAELARADTPGEKNVAKTHLKAAADRFVRDDAARLRAGTSGGPFGMLGPQISGAYYDRAARADLGRILGSGFAAPSSHVACVDVASPEVRMRNTLGKLLGALRVLDGQLQGLLGRLATQSSTSVGGGNDELSRIANDPSLSIEDKIMLFMSKYIEKNNQELNQKLQELAKAKQSQQSSGGLTGFLKSIAGVIPGVGQAVDAISGAVSGGPAGAAQDTTTLESQVQALTNKREQLVTMLTNLMKVLQETIMSIIRNLQA